MYRRSLESWIQELREFGVGWGGVDFRRRCGDGGGGGGGGAKTRI